MITQTTARRRASAASAAVAAVAAVLLLAACTIDEHRYQGGDPTGPPPPPRVHPTATPAATPSASADPLADCPASGVRIRSTGGDAAMGLRALGVELINCGERPYRLNGYPVLWVLDEQRKPIILSVVNGAKEITSGFDEPPRPVTLQRGERAVATVLWRNLVTDSEVVATAGTYLTVAPSAGQPAEEVDPDGPVDVGNTGQIGVSAWKKATT
ncbi:DUF4232 domain-containing protein [Micromonospora lupini]|uniref:DUF4232 domain-containing protein n=1 Tax=Micromonospora lupini TaxID=285679 RepID=UPI002251C912|nr:DUF4232 domain-containing protein [Micromonospora lupini]MCX5067933.1 DUF4232 domain-containing protein [Micromonospora lupini]